MLLLTGGQHEDQQDLLAAMGVREPIWRLGLQDHADHRALRTCSGESGFIQHKAAVNPQLAPIVEELAKQVRAQQHRPGGAVIGLCCKSGMHRSVAVAVMASRVLQEWGWSTELRHLGKRRAATCECWQGPLRTRCPAVMHELSVHQWWSRESHGAIAEDLYGTHLRLRLDATAAMALLMRAQFRAAGLGHLVGAEG